MDDALLFASALFRRFAAGLFRLALAFLLLAATRGAHAELTHISAADSAKLARDFDAAKFEPSSRVSGTAWACDLFGMRSKMQVQHDLKLYVLTAGNSAGKSVQSFVNKGDEPIAEYEVKGSTLEGHGDEGLLDQIRLTKDGRLVSKLSIPSRGITLAYAVCTGS